MYSTTPFIIANRELKPYEIERRTSISIERWLKDKFREGFKQLKKEFIREDTESTGKVSSCFFRESIFHNMAQYLLFFSFSNDIFFIYTNDKKKRLFCRLAVMCSVVSLPSMDYIFVMKLHSTCS